MGCRGCEGPVTGAGPRSAAELLSRRLRALSTRVQHMSIRHGVRTQHVLPVLRGAWSETPRVRGLFNHGPGAVTTSFFAMICLFFLENSSGLFFPSLLLLATSFPVGFGARPGWLCVLRGEARSVQPVLCPGLTRVPSQPRALHVSPASHERLTHPVSLSAARSPGPL